MIISDKFPPNWADIKRTFNLEGKKPVFCYGNTLYNPFKGEIDAALMAHEITHSKQQGNNPSYWWGRYLSDPAFRTAQEINAYQIQFRAMKEIIKDRERLNKQLIRLAGDLSGEMYGKTLTFQEAYEAIKGGKKINIL